MDEVAISAEIQYSTEQPETHERGEAEQRHLIPDGDRLRPPIGGGAPLGSGEGANPTAAPTREQQAFAAWKEELNLEERILENIAHRYNLEYACQRVKSNKGAPGIDGMSVEELERWLNTHMAELREQLLNGSYRPQEVKGVSNVLLDEPNGESEKYCE